MVTGYSYGLGSYYDYHTIKYAAADGAFLWEKRYDGPAHKFDIPRALVVDASGACCGIVVLADIAQHAKRREAAEVVKEVSAPSASASAAGR